MIICYYWWLFVIIDNCSFIIDDYRGKLNFSSIIIEVIRLVLNFLFLFTIRFHKYKKAFFYQYRLKVDLVLYTYVFIYLKATIKKFWVLILLLI